MLWQIEDTPHKLIGSVHVLPKGARLPWWVHESYADIGRFVFEADHRDPTLQQVGRDEEGSCWQPTRASIAYNQAARLLASIGRTEPFDGLKPWKAAFYFLLCLMSHAGLSHSDGVDNLLRTKAEQGGHAIDYLELPTRAFDLLDSSCEQAIGGLPFFEDVIRNTDSGRGLTELERIMRAWVSSDIEDLEVILSEKKARFSFMFEPLITQRNREWLPVAARLLCEDVPTLFVVGSLHTVGHDSFIDQLRSIGLRCRLTSANG